MPKLLRTHYKARVRRIMLLFPHDKSPGTGSLRRNVPITSPRSTERTSRAPCENGQALPGRGKSMSRGQTLFRYRRQRLRMFRQGVEVGDHVGAFAVLGNASKPHRGAGNIALGIGDELVQLVKAPGASLGLHRGGEIETAAF